jgi:tetratricopeptide (TPR) repeat protein
LNEILSFLEIKISLTASVYTKAEAIANRLRSERLLLILDGLEPLLGPRGEIQDAALKALLQELRTGNRGLVVCTTRVKMEVPDDAPRSLSIELFNLTPEQGAQYLRFLKTEGSEEELQAASAEYWNNALALTLLGTYLSSFCGRDVARRLEIPDLVHGEVGQDCIVPRLVAAYERMFIGRPELGILKALGYFNRPAEPEALKLVLPAIDARSFRGALKRLHSARLILTPDPADAIDCHPLIRQCFACRASSKGHAHLYRHYADRAELWPATTEAMKPLLHAVYHGCRAERHEHCLDQVYRKRILRGDQEAFLNKGLGENGTSLAVLANFFEVPWSVPVSTLSQPAKAKVIGDAGYALRAVGRLDDAVATMRAAVEIGDLESAASGYGNLSELYAVLGKLPEAIVAAQESVRLADRGGTVDFANPSGDWYFKVRCRATLADALHNSGHLQDALAVFGESEQIQARHRPETPKLISLMGFQYCELLLRQGATEEVLARATEILRAATAHNRLLDIGLSHILLAYGYDRYSTEAKLHFDEAVDVLRRAGTIHRLPLALLARGTQGDLAEVVRIATRSGMRLYLVDYHLASARLAVDLDERSKHIESAAGLITTTGYHRRDAEIQRLRASLGR